MRKLIIAVVVILALVGGAVAFALSNLNGYLKENKAWLESQVEAALGRDVSFEEVTVSLAGGLGARVKKLRVAEDEKFGKKDEFLKADDVQVVVGIWPALFGRYEVRKILLDAPELSIIRTSAGFNFDSIGKQPGAAAAPAAPKAEPEAKEPAQSEAPPPAAAAAFLVSKTEIRGGKLRYLDRTVKPASDLVIRKLDFSASDVSLDAPISLQMAAALFGAEDQNLSLAGTIGPLGSPPDVQKAPLDMRLDLGPLVIDEVKKLPALAGAIPPELSSPDPIRLQMTVKGTPGEVALQTQMDAESAKLVYGSTFTKPKGTAMKLDLDATRSGETVRVKSFVFRLAALELKGKGTVTTGDAAAVDFQIDSNRAPLSGWNEMLPALAGQEVSGEFEMHVRAKGKTGAGRMPALEGSVVLENMNARMAGSPHEIEGLSTRIEFRQDSLVVPPTKFRLGGSPVEVQAAVESLKARKGTFSLRSPALRAASLGVAAEEAEREEVIRSLDLSGTFSAPPGKAPDFRGNLRSEGGSLRDVDYQDLRADFALREQVATLDKLALKAFEGTYDGAGRYEMRDPNEPKFDFRSTIRGMNLKGLLQSKLPGAEQKIEGRLDADLRLDGSGREWESIRDRLRGDGRIDVKDGVLKDVNLAEDVLTGVTGIPGLSNFVSPRTRQKYPELFETGDTKFEKLGGSVQIAEGRATTDDLTLAARDYSMLGRGTFHLENRLDFTATFVASKNLSDDVIADVREAKYLTNEQGRVAIPFRLTGSLPKVTPKPDSAFITQAIGRAVVGKGLEKLLGGPKPSGAETPGDQPTPRPEQELLRKGLEGLFGR